MANAAPPRRLVAGNWKMNHKLMLAQVHLLKQALAEKPPRCEVAICPPATLIATVAQGEMSLSTIAVGGQDCHPEPSGAFTGDISAEALRDAGATIVILGHSERRHGHGETDELIERKVKAARRAGLRAIVCVGETEGERDSGQTIAVVGGQIAHSLPSDVALDALVIAYEPVWAIGSGKIPSNADIEQVHGFIRAEFVKRFGAGAASVAILYGGSVKPSNAGEILKLKDVDGALVGGASLKASDFMAIIEAA